MSTSLASILGGVAGGLALVVIVISFLWFCISRRKKLLHRNSDTGSSDPSALVEWNNGGVSTSARHPLSGQQVARQFTLGELEQATKQFSESNLIGEGSFGLVYKGLLSDGTVVAIKRRYGTPLHEFVQEVSYLSEIWHRNLVTLLGYCQEDGFQMLVFEYLPNGSISNHLHDSKQDSPTQLEFKQRLSIALGAAKGLCHLHGLRPPLLHKNFRTSNVLVDENFIAKVADAGIFKLLEKIEDTGFSSRTSEYNMFQEPGDAESGTFSEKRDVYSFGVFLLEIITGEELSKISFLVSNESLVEWVKSRVISNTIVDSRLTGSFTPEGMKDLFRLTLWCLNINGKGRPKMEMTVTELERILEKEMTRTTVMGESTATFTLGSELFTPS